jgi:flagellar biosynthesis protein FliR
MPDFLRLILAPANWPTFVYVTGRLTGLMLVGPLWSLAMVPRQIRGAIVVLLAVMLLPTTPRVAMPEEALQIPVPLAMEILIGVAIGLTAAVIVQGVAYAGEVIAIQMGLALGPAISGMVDLEVSGVGQIKGLLALLIYVSIGGHMMLLQGLAQSLQTVPPGTPLLLDGGGDAIMLFGSLFSTALQAASPVMAALLLTNAALAILNRAVPQMNAMMVALPLTIGVGLIMVGAALPFLANNIGGWLSSLPADGVRAIDSFHRAGS